MNDETFIEENGIDNTAGETSDETLSDLYIYYPGSVQIINDGLTDKSDPVEESSSEEEIYLQDLQTEEQVKVENILMSDNSNRSALSGSHIRNLWKLSVDGSEIQVLFPTDSNLDIIDGVLVNLGSNSVTGVVIDSSLSDSSYFHYTFTILPFTSNNTQNSVYRYGARSYLTEYTVGTSYNNLVTSVTYSNADVITRPAGYMYTKPELMICALLAFSIIFSLIGGIIRR